MNTAPRVLGLYRSILRTGNQFSDYNFRSYVVRNTKERFRENKQVSDPQIVTNLIKDAENNYGILQRQSTISKLYKAPQLVVEV